MKIHHCRIKLFAQNCKIFRSPKLKTHKKKNLVYTDKSNPRKGKKKKKDFRKKQYSFHGGCQSALLCGGFDMVEAKLMQKRPSFKEIRD